MLVHSSFVDYFAIFLALEMFQGIMLFLSNVRYLPYFHFVLPYTLDALDKKSVSLSIHRATRRKSENIEP